MAVNTAGWPKYIMKVLLQASHLKTRFYIVLYEWYLKSSSLLIDEITYKWSDRHLVDAKTGKNSE